jgi:hypothetical protein
MSLMRRDSVFAMIHVKRVAGHACCIVRSTGTTWQVSPMAERRKRHTVRGGWASGNITEVLQ